MRCSRSRPGRWPTGTGRGRVLTGCVVGWSAATAATAGVGGAAGLLSARLLLGAAEAGAYPAATGLVRSWAAPGERGRFSSIVTLGGRIGGAVAPYLTGALAVGLAGWGPSATARAGPEGNWRAVLVVYGGCGFVVAGLLWAVVRDRPAAAGRPPAVASAHRRDRLGGAARDPGDPAGTCGCRGRPSSA